MGTWGPGSFENDTALDFLAGLTDGAQLDAFLSGHEFDSEFRETASGAEQSLAAADLVACMIGRPGTDATAAIRAKAAGFGEVGHDLLQQARNAVSGVMGGSELLELWGESDRAEFNLAVTDLMNRLNPDVGYVPVPAPNDGPVIEHHCIFCNEIVAPEEVLSLRISSEDATGLTSTDIRTCHLRCLNKVVHPSQMLQRWVLSDEMLDAEMQKFQERQEARSQHDDDGS